MSRTFHHGDRKIRIKGLRRQPADLKKLAEALLELSREVEAQKADKQLHAPRRAGADVTPMPERAAREDQAA